MIPPSAPRADAGASYVCASCGKKFTNQRELDRHYRSCHFECDRCNTQYRSIQALREHLGLAHQGNTCPSESCLYWSTEESDLRRHVEKHIFDTANQTHLLELDSAGFGRIATASARRVTREERAVKTAEMSEKDEARSMSDGLVHQDDSGQDEESEAETIVLLGKNRHSLGFAARESTPSREVTQEEKAVKTAELSETDEPLSGSAGFVYQDESGQDKDCEAETERLPADGHVPSKVRKMERHGDIIPENILWYKDSSARPKSLASGKFVLSDFGLSALNHKYTCINIDNVTTRSASRRQDTRKERIVDEAELTDQDKARWAKRFESSDQSGDSPGDDTPKAGRRRRRDDNTHRDDDGFQYPAHPPTTYTPTSAQKAGVTKPASSSMPRPVSPSDKHPRTPKTLPGNELFAQMLEAANRQHLSADNVPVPGPPRSSSPFVQGSPLAPTPSHELQLRRQSSGGAMQATLQPVENNDVLETQSLPHELAQMLTVTNHEQLREETKVYQEQTQINEGQALEDYWSAEIETSGRAVDDTNEETTEQALDDHLHARAVGTRNPSGDDPTKTQRAVKRVLFLLKSEIDLSHLAEVIRRPVERGGVRMQTRRWHLRLHHNCFSGSDMTSWLLDNFEDVANREEAVLLGQRLMVNVVAYGNTTDRGLFVHVKNKHAFRDGEFFYQLRSPLYWWPSPELEAPQAEDQQLKARLDLSCPAGHEQSFLPQIRPRVSEQSNNSQPLEAIAPQTDSGYASLPRGKAAPQPLEAAQTDVTSPVPDVNTDVTAESEMGDVNTVYSDDRSQASATRTQRYVSEFVDHLFGKIKHQIDHNSIARLADCLPELLQAFALKVGQASSTGGHYEVMFFVHKHRRSITQSFQRRVDQDEAHGSAEVDDRCIDPSDMCLDDKLSLWAKKTADVGSERVFEADDQSNIEPLEDDIDLEELDRYQILIKDSPAFDWLLGSLHRELQLSNSAVDGMMQIRREILQGLPSPSRISRKQASPLVEVVFTAAWDPATFIKEQGYETDDEDILGKVITLIGSSADVQAATCEQYLCQTWPATGKHMLRIIQDAARKGAAPPEEYSHRRTYVLPDNTRITASCADQILTLEASGTAYSMVEIGEQLGWLVTALRASADESKISVLCPTVESFRPGADASLPFHCDIGISYIGEAPPTLAAGNGDCWHTMFRNPIMVWGYPILRREQLDSGTGLEIPLDILMALADAKYISEFNDKIYVKGYSAMLIPTRQVDNLVLWHLLYNEDGSRISYTDCRIAALDHIHPTGVKQARHILGWVSHARNNTGSPSANYDIKWSGLGKPRERHAWEKIIISGGDPVGVSASFVIGKKDKGVFAGGLGGYASRLKFIAKQYVVLYDLADRRAWLVDGLSALHHLVRASLEHDQKDVFNQYFLYKQGQMKECSTSMHGQDAAAAVLFSAENCSLRLYTESEDTWDEETEKQKNGSQGGGTVKEVVSKRKVTYYCLRDRVLEIFSLLEKMIDHLNNVQSESGVGFRLRGTPRNILEGFDFMDVATNSAPLRPHMIKLNICESGRGWTDLLRSVQAITLFGKGFGELIAPSPDNLAGPACGGCGFGASLPTGKDYLATCVNLVERILTTRGSMETIPWCLADDIYWHTPGPLFDPCQCTTTKNGASRVQVLLPSTFPKLWGRDFASPTRLDPAGAVMFSHNWKVPFRLGFQSSQEKHTLEPPDSGLGTSIDSSSGRSQLSGSVNDADSQISNAADGSSTRSMVSTAEAGVVTSTGGPALKPDNGTSSRKRKLVDIVDRVKRKVMEPSSSIELEELAGDGLDIISQTGLSSLRRARP